MIEIKCRLLTLHTIIFKQHMKEIIVNEIIFVWPLGKLSESKPKNKPRSVMYMSKALCAVRGAEVASHSILAPNLTTPHPSSRLEIAPDLH